MGGIELKKIILPQVHLVAGARVPCARCSIPSGEHGTRDEDAVPLLEVAASLDPSHVGALSSLAYLLISGSAEVQKRMLLILSKRRGKRHVAEQPPPVAAPWRIPARRAVRR